jgi:FkbM family methyltransferase
MFSVDADETVEPPHQEFASFHHFPFALYSSEGEMDLFVTGHPAMTSLLELDEAAFTRHFGLIPGSETWKEGLTATHTQGVRTRRADELFESQGLSRVDFFKLDTQGTELEILKGAHEYLSSGRISVVKTEVSFLPIYREQCEFSDIDRLLKGHGFLLVDCGFYGGSVRPKRWDTAIRGVNLREELRLNVVGDAVYVLDPVRYPERDRAASTIRSAVQLNQLGYVSVAFDLLRGEGHAIEFAEDLLRATVRRDGFNAKLGRWLRRRLRLRTRRSVPRLGASSSFPR